MDDPDVAIIGYGPVGQTLGILLGRRGWRVAIFEKQPAPYPMPRAVHFDHEVARILQSAGLGSELPALTEPADTYEWRNGAGDTLLRFTNAPTSLSGWPEANMFYQPDLERALDRHVRSLPAITVERAVEVVAAEPSATGVSLALARLDGGRQSVRAKWVVGCDGANSFLRRALGIPVTDLGFFFDWLIVDIQPRERRTWTPINLQICDPARPTTLVSGGPGRRRWEFMCLPAESIDDLNNEATAWRLLASFGVTPATATLERHAVYRFQARWLDRWRDGRCLLAGDAAHQMPPFAGQGMCSGLRDAANLAWKLDLVLRGDAAGQLLDTYASERIPHVRAMIDFSIGLGRVICVPDAAEAAARDRAMTAALTAGGPTVPPPIPTPGPGIFAPEDPLAGHLFHQGLVRRDGASSRFDDVVGTGFALVSPHGDPAEHLGPDAARFWRSIGGITAHVAPKHVPLVDVDSSYARWFAEHGVGLVLQRPDFSIFGTAAAPTGADALVTRLQRRLTEVPA